ncbi:MAG: hypothetical protein LQ349_007452 [Xanthoria aureola]|nr:MAG: hypothetical protein LQ349_007452 [Xanthoria aureola]
MAFHESVHSDLPEATPFQGLEHHIPASEQKQLYLPDHQGKENHLPPAEISPENWHVKHPASHDAPGSDPYWHPTLSDPNATQPQRGPWWRRKRFWIPLVTLLLIGAIVGGVVGGLSNRNDSPSNPPSPSPASIPAPPSPKPLNSSLASVAWSDRSRVAYRRLYYQDAVGTIKESAWNSTGNEWYWSNENVAKAKLNSPIAASVAGNTTWPFQITLYYLDLQGHLIEWYTNDGQEWKSGRLTNQDIIPSPNSDLATIWTQTDHNSCNECGRQTLLMAYQDSNDKIWVVNATRSQPILTTLKADAAPGTGLAFQSVWHRRGSPGLRIYYQRGADDLMTIDYEDSLYGAQVTGPLAGGAPVASFSSGDDTDRGNPLFQYTLSSSSRGINVAWLGGGSNYGTGWHTESPEVMKNVQPYSPVAANADRHVYALEDGAVKEFVVSTDGTTWSLVGDVPTLN